MDIHEAFAWYDRAIDNAIDYLNLDREEQDKAWNVIDKFIDEAIARQSATSEEVVEAIEYLQPLTEHAVMSGKFVKHLKTAIAALKAYQPTTRKDRIVEEVAISKTETTSEPCKYCDKPIYLKWNVSFIDGYYKLNDDCNYCPNCGRKLN